nr:hypothetical protein B0A51_03854 [Rachicladosporium sp. CCFEE 5018]
MANSILRASLLMAGLLGPAAAHMRMAHPVPFSPQMLGSSPIDASTFPCKIGASDGAGAYSLTVSTMNKMVVGQDQTLDFMPGGAPHNGGTCQLAISLDATPTKDSIWKIIQVYEGGCPVPKDATDGTHGTYSFKIPDGFPNADTATFAWTWFNRVGNREMYMNCAPISIGGGSESKDYYNSLPNMYVINLGQGDTCKSTDSKDLKIPNPGQFVVTGGVDAAVEPTGAGCAAAAAAQTQGVQGYSSMAASSPAASSAQVTSPPAAASTPDPTGYATVPTTVAFTSSTLVSPPKSTAAPVASTMLTVPTSAATMPMGTDSPVYPTFTIRSTAHGVFGAGSTGVPVGTGGLPALATSAVASAAAPTSSTPATDPSTSAGSAESSTCTTDGAVVCNGDSQFGLCDHGKVVWQAVAAGTKCTNGAILKRDIFESPQDWQRRHARGGWSNGPEKLREDSIGLAQPRNGP